jgi:hypothetical protein
MREGGCLLVLLLLLLFVLLVLILGLRLLGLGCLLLGGLLSLGSATTTRGLVLRSTNTGRCRAIAGGSAHAAGPQLEQRQ